MNIFVGNLAPTVSSDDLRRLFAGFGTVIRALVIRDTNTDRPLGHGHVYLVPEDAAQQAVEKLNQAMVAGQHIVVRECTPRTRHDRRKSILPWHGIERRQEQRRTSSHSENAHGAGSRDTHPADPDPNPATDHR